MLHFSHKKHFGYFFKVLNIVDLISSYTDVCSNMLFAAEMECRGPQSLTMGPPVGELGGCVGETISINVCRKYLSYRCM